MGRKEVAVKYTEGKQNGSLMAHLADFWPPEELVVWKRQYLFPNKYTSIIQYMTPAAFPRSF